MRCERMWLTGASMNVVQSGTIAILWVIQKLYPVPHLQEKQHEALLLYRPSYFFDIKPNIFQLTSLH